MAYGLVDLVERMLVKRYELRPKAADIHGELERVRTGGTSPEYEAYDLGDAVQAIPSTEQVTSRIRVRG